MLCIVRPRANNSGFYSKYDLQEFNDGNILHLHNIETFILLPKTVILILLSVTSGLWGWGVHPYSRDHTVYGLY